MNTAKHVAPESAASGGPVAKVRRIHAGGRVRSIGYQACDLLPGANVQDGAMLYATPQPARAPLTQEQLTALDFMLSHYGDDPRVRCLRPLLDGITAKVPQ